MVLLNALLAVWGSAVTRRTGATAGYADDVHAVANTEGEVHGAARVTKEFIAAADMKVKREGLLTAASKDEVWTSGARTPHTPLFCRFYFILFWRKMDCLPPPSSSVRVIPQIAPSVRGGSFFD